jgi:RNA polymerase sigma-70 factor (ECF subfamily)
MYRIEDIISQYGRALGRVAASYEADRSLQEDLMQDILLAIHKSLPNLRDSDRLAPFVFRVAHNRGVSHVVRQMAAKRASPAEDDVEAPTVEDRLIEDERSARLMRAIRQLPLPYREVILLVLEDLSHAEIAETLQISTTNVAVRVNRAKARLKELLSHD